MQDHQVNGLDVMLYYWDESQTQPQPFMPQASSWTQTTLTQLSFPAQVQGGQGPKHVSSTGPGVGRATLLQRSVYAVGPIPV